MGNMSKQMFLGYMILFTHSGGYITLLHVVVLTSSTVGFNTKFPSILPTRITPIGPFQGTSDSISAAEDAFAAITSGSCFPSEERTFTVIYKSGTQLHQ
jgi:hypothetical protein